MSIPSPHHNERLNIINAIDNIGFTPCPQPEKVQLTFIFDVNKLPKAILLPAQFHKAGKEAQSIIRKITGLTGTFVCSLESGMYQVDLLFDKDKESALRQAWPDISHTIRDFQAQHSL